MAEDKFDDLDDVLDDFELGNHVLNRPPGHALAQMSLGDSSVAGEAKDSPISAADTAAKGQTREAKLELASDTNVHGEDSTGPQEARVVDKIPEKTKPEEDEELASELRKGMDSLLREMDNDPEARNMFESLMAQTGFMDQAKNGAADNVLRSNTTHASSVTEPASFEDTISATVNRLHESRNSPQPSADGGDAFLEQMLKELQGAAGAGDSGAGMDSLLAGLMEELSSKDVLYEPLKEMHDKYPAWLERNVDKLEKSEIDRYKKQQKVVKEIVTKFEDPSYSDKNTEARSFITMKMEEMQDTGAPPEELIGDLADGALPGLGGAAGGGAPDCGMQ